jgi:hypothetical protein
METFLDKHASSLRGILSGFDRILFRGLLMPLVYSKGFDGFLGGHGILYKDFKRFVERISGHLHEHAKELANSQGRPYHYIPSARLSKEDFAREIMEQDQIQEGLICVLGCVEPCQSFSIRRNPTTKQPHLVSEQRKCLHLYFYYVDPEFGFMHIRLQTWFPLSIQVCINGREYLAKQLDRYGIGYEQRDNCFTWIEDLPRAQKLMDKLEKRRWVRILNRLARKVNPLLYRRNPMKLDLRDYYWTVRQSEHAMDLMFKDRQSLQAVYPLLIRHAINEFGSEDVLRFLGRRTNSRFNGEVSSNIKTRDEGVRIKHWVEENSIKMYDKQGTVLRIETTINNPRRFKVRRSVTRQGEELMAWVAMRKGVADLRRRAEICRASNERYLQALAVVGASVPTRHLIDRVSKRITRCGRAYRGLRPFQMEEAAAFRVFLSGEFLLQGFRNKDIRRRLHPSAERRAADRQRAAGKITRLLRLFRAHGLIKKISHTSYYRVTNLGHRIMAVALRLREIDIPQLAC